MKKVYLFLVLSLLILGSTNVSKGQYIGFTPGDNAELVCDGTSTTKTFPLNWTWELSQYPYVLGAFAKLIIGNDTYYSNIYNTDLGSFAQSWTLPAGTHTWTMELHESYDGYHFTKRYSVTNTFYIKYRVYAANNFGGGSILIDSENKTSGDSKIKMVGESISVEAIDQPYSNYNRLWNSNGTNNSNWQRNFIPISGASERNLSYSISNDDNGITLVADMKKLCNATFQNSGGTIYIGYNQYSSSVQVQVVEQNSVNATCPNTSSGGIDGVFTGWTYNGNNYGSQVTVSEHSTFTPTFSYKPSTAGRGLAFSTNGQNQIILTWQPHQTCTVYRVYRRVGKVNPTPVMMLQTSSLTFTDPDYINTGDMEDEWISYDVRPVYNNVESDPDWEGPIFGLIWVAKNENIESIGLAHEVPTEYSISNYPNPFNPETTINYQLPEKSFVSIKVYDILGKEVAELVNENKSAGYYKVNFDGGKLTSGIYIAAIQANNFSKSIKLLLTK